MTENRATTIWTIGHNARTVAELVAVLQVHAIVWVVDVRRFPRSRRHPHFSRDRLAVSLPAAGVRYESRPGLGGMREPDGSLTNAGLRACAFRGFADYMQTVEFSTPLAALLALAREQPTAILCAEAVPEECHRSLIADALVARQVVVEHILDGAATRLHTITASARLDGARVSYPPAQTELGIGRAER